MVHPDTMDLMSRMVAGGELSDLTQERVLRLLPPLVIEQDDLRRFAETLEAILTGK